MRNLIKLLVPYLSEPQKKLVAEVNEGFMSIGKALTPEMQVFISENWRELPKFLRTEEGKLDLQQFVNDWINLTTKDSK